MAILHNYTAEFAAKAQHKGAKRSAEYFCSSFVGKALESCNRQDGTRTYGYSDESRKKKPVDLVESNIQSIS